MLTDGPLLYVLRAARFCLFLCLGSLADRVSLQIMSISADGFDLESVEAN